MSKYEQEKNNLVLPIIGGAVMFIGLVATYLGVQ